MTAKTILDKYRKIKEYIHNSFWMMSEKFISLGVGFLVTVVVARYLGPEKFGLLSYVLSVSALFSAAGHMGLSGLVVREIVSSPDRRGETLGTTLVLKLLGMLIGYVGMLLYSALYEGIDSIEFVMIAVAGAALILNSSSVIDFWFQAFLQARYVTFARVVALIAGNSFKLLLVFFGSAVFLFSAAPLLQAVVAAMMLVIMYSLYSGVNISEWSFSWGRAKELLGQGWLIYLGSIFAVVYLKVDQIMIRWFLGSDAVGIYAVAAQLSEAWYFLPVALASSFFPKLIKLREKNICDFHHRLQQLFDALFFIAVAVAFFMTVMSEQIIMLFFGEHYLDSASVLVIHIWAALFIFMRAALSKWIIIEGVLVFSLITQGAGAVCNIVLNYFLIPEFGIEGAAYSTLISYAVASVFSLSIYRKTRPIFFMMMKSFICPIRLSWRVVVK